MDCPNCKTKMKVVRSFFRGSARWRERRCPNSKCRTVIRTRETQELTATLYRAEFARYRHDHWTQSKLDFPPTPTSPSLR